MKNNWDNYYVFLYILRYPRKEVYKLQWRDQGNISKELILVEVLKMIQFTNARFSDIQHQKHLQNCLHCVILSALYSWGCQVVYHLSMRVNQSAANSETTGKKEIGRNDLNQWTGLREGGMSSSQANVWRFQPICPRIAVESTINTVCKTCSLSPDYITWFSWPITLFWRGETVAASAAGGLNLWCLLHVQLEMSS